MARDDNATKPATGARPPRERLTTHLIAAGAVGVDFTEEQITAPGYVQAPCCGRSVPALHLLEADDTLTQPSWRVGSQVHGALCGVEVTDSTPVPDYEICPGCTDCVRYCTNCVRVAAEYSQRPL